MKIEFLGFPSCPNTPVLRDHLKAALQQIEARIDFIDINQETLPEDDIRRGYPAPTILVNGVDLFGMPEPTHGARGCRVYAGGLPSTNQIAASLKLLSAQEILDEAHVQKM